MILLFIQLKYWSLNRLNQLRPWRLGIMIGVNHASEKFIIFPSLFLLLEMRIFYCHPSTSRVVYLDKGVSINTNNISATISLDTLDENVYHSFLNKIISTLKSNLPQIHSEISPWNSKLEAFIQALENKEAVKKN